MDSKLYRYLPSGNTVEYLEKQYVETELHSQLVGIFSRANKGSIDHGIYVGWQLGYKADTRVGP